MVLSVWGKTMVPMYRYDYMAYMDYMDPDLLWPRKASKLNRSLTYAVTIA